MADNARPPVAVRTIRPYPDEETFLENELETVGKTSVILIGAHSRPTGVILRFEVTLESGATVLRGEGRVLAHKENAFRGQPGLALRFTRLDPKSKALIDKAAALREARLGAPSSNAVPSDEPSRPEASEPSRDMPPVSEAAPDPGLAGVFTSPTPPPHAFRPRSAPPRPASVQPGVETPSQTFDLPSFPETPSQQIEVSEPFSAPLSSSDIVEVVSAPDLPRASSDPPAAPFTTHDVTTPQAKSAAPPSLLRDREGLLSRLRERAQKLTPEQRARILGS